MISNYRSFIVGEPKGRALLSYLPDKVQDLSEYELPGNRMLANYIPRALNEMGYIVDYIDWKDTKWKRNNDYDLFIGHGGYNFEHVSRQLDSTKQIYFSSGFYWQLFNYLELQRFEALRRRKGKELIPDRLIRISEDYALYKSDGIITLGNRITAESYSKFPNVHSIGGLPQQTIWDKEKDYHSGRKHFLFFAGDGNVHKGLDLLLEAFAGTNLQLHICQKLEPQFKSVYFKELTECDNIHYYGKISLRSPLYMELIMMCNWIVSASCCEGCPNAVLESMQHGLIPVLTRNNSIDTNGFGVELNESYIRDIVMQISNMDIDECRYKSYMSRKKIDTDYSPLSFTSKFKDAVTKCLQ